jgi:hypothetical protein
MEEDLVQKIEANPKYQKLVSMMLVVITVTSL